LEAVLTQPDFIMNGLSAYPKHAMKEPDMQKALNLPDLRFNALKISLLARLIRGLIYRVTKTSLKSSLTKVMNN